MKSGAHILFLFCLLGCGAIRESELSAPVIRVDAKPAACEFPKQIDTQADVLSAVSCLEKNLDNAFDSLEGKVENELSLNELKKLQEAGILEFAVGDNQQWNGISAFLSLIHPEGKEAISRNKIKRFLEWLRTKTDFLAKIVNWEDHKGKKAPLAQDLFRELVIFSDELVAFLSDEGSASLDQVEALIHLFQINKKEADIVGKTHRKLPALWRLKALVLESTRADDKMRGASLKRFLKAAVKIARDTEQTYGWWEDDFHPAKAPDHIELEWANVIETATHYLGETTTYDLDTEEMRAQVRVLLPDAEFADRIPDLVKASQRLLAHKGDKHSGLLYGLLHLFDGAEKVADSLRAAARMFSHCTQAEPCSVSSRQALTHSRIRPIALISTQDWNAKAMENSSSSLLPKRLDGQIQWKTVLKRLLEKGVVTNIFDAYDRNEDEAIPYRGETPQDLKEAMDVAYTLISLIPTRNGIDVDDGSIPFSVKPSTLVGAIGLLGDEWVHPGNRDGKIDPDEFYAALKVYEDINFIARHSSLSSEAYTKESDEALKPLARVNDQLYVIRSQFIARMGTVYEKELPYLISVFKSLEKNNGGAKALFEVLVPKYDKSLTLYKHGNPSETISHTDYLSREDMIRPVSTLVLLDRLILKCDKNEDELFSWDELDCVAPLAIEAGKQLFGSDLMELPPFVSDAAIYALDTLSKKGLPHTLSKTILMNGGMKRERFKPQFIRWVKDDTQANVKEIAAMFSELTDAKEEELRKEISVAVIAANSSVRGLYAWKWSKGDPNTTDIVDGVAEWDSATSNLITEGIFKKASERTDGFLSQEGLTNLWTNLPTYRQEYKRFNAMKTLLPLAMVLASKPSQSAAFFNKTTGEAPFRLDPISPANILSLLEGLLE